MNIAPDFLESLDANAPAPVKTLIILQESARDSADFLSGMLDPYDVDFYWVPNGKNLVSIKDSSIPFFKGFDSFVFVETVPSESLAGILSGTPLIGVSKYAFKRSLLIQKGALAAIPSKEALSSLGPLIQNSVNFYKRARRSAERSFSDNPVAIYRVDENQSIGLCESNYEFQRIEDNNFFMSSLENFIRDNLKVALAKGVFVKEFHCSNPTSDYRVLLKSEEKELVVTLIDISQEMQLIRSKKANKEKLSALTESLEEERRMRAELAGYATVAEYSSSITHEIATPMSILSTKLSFLVEELASVLGLSEDEIDELLLDPSAYAFSGKSINISSKNFLEIWSTVASMDKAIQGSKRIIQSMRSLAHGVRSASHNNEVFSLLSLFEDTSSWIKERVESSGISLSFSKEGSSNICLNAVPSEVRQILANLISNARDAVTNTSSPWIKVSFSVDYGEPSATSGQSLQPQVFIRVTDSGSGVPEGFRARLFKPFQTTKGVTNGTGLGLSLSKKFAQKFGGDLVYNQNSPNTEFVLRLPFTDSTGGKTA